ncbi:MAG: PEP-CTERM sorting domain-containing protein [Proteobacteria bacterium]|nr:PEP-CTERM sorting domain-containing protein [Pseudomonadota bacterium]MDP2105207.1 PEP-CTERM sorting domain-containing protein [Desulfobulbaceae bacterium]
MTTNTRSKKIYRTLATLAVAAVFTSVPMAAEATPTYLDISSYNITVANPTSGNHIFTGNAWQYITVLGGVGTPITETFLLTYNETTDSGTFSIGTLLSGDIEDLDLNETFINTAGAWGAGDMFQFSVINATGTLNSGQLWSGDITIDLGAGNGDGVSNTIVNAPVPEPATISLMLLGGSALVGLRRRRKTHIS